MNRVDNIDFAVQESLKEKMIIDGRKNLRSFNGFLKNAHVMIVLYLIIMSYQIPGTAPNMDETRSIKRRNKKAVPKFMVGKKNTVT